MKFKVTVVCLAAAFALLFSLRATTDEGFSEIVSTAEGQVKGDCSGAVCSWKGIPYAAPPVGELRWKAPQDALAHEAVLNAMDFGAKCPQVDSKWQGGDGKSVVGSEDCLSLNIWRPNKAGKFPVMFWIHGGALIQGTGSTPLYYGDNLAAKKDVVVVSINYRLGVFGFLSLPEFAAEDPSGGAGNYGLLDQIRAMEWVRDNIANFGGDPGNVTIFGESAGGWSVCAQLASPLAAGLFHKAIIESGGGRSVLTKEQGYEHGKEFAASLGCQGKDAAACLRGKPGAEIFAIIPDPGVKDVGKGGRLFSFVPKVDGVFLKEVPVEAISAGRYNQVPLLVGSTRDEMKFFTQAVPGIRFLPPWTIKRFMGMNYGRDGNRRFRELYPYRDYRLPGDALIDALGDASLGCANFEAAEASALHETRTYYYRFDFDDHKKPHSLGAPHGIEIAFVFDNLSALSAFGNLVSEEQMKKAQSLAGMVSTYWTNFAKTGDPNGEGLLKWPEYNLTSRERMYLDLPPAVRETDNVDKCAFWAERRFLQ